VERVVQLLPDLGDEELEVLEEADLACLREGVEEPAIQPLPNLECEVEAVLEEVDLACLQVVEAVALVLSEQGRHWLWGEGKPLPAWRKRPR